MTTASNNGANRATRRVMEGMTVNTMTNRGRREYDTPIDHAPSSVWPQPDNVTAYLRDNARHGATLVTRNGVSIVETGHATTMRTLDGGETVAAFAPSFMAREYVASVNMRQATQDAWDGYPTEHFGRTI